MSGVCPCHGEPWYVNPADGRRRCHVRKRENTRLADERRPDLHDARRRRDYESDGSWRRRRLAIVRGVAAERGGCCSRCGRGGFAGGYAWHWHHRDPATRRFWIADIRKGMVCSDDDLRRELDACDLVCQSCHVLIHAERRRAAS